MSRKPPHSFLSETILLLVRHFGVDKVRDALPDRAQKDIPTGTKPRPMRKKPLQPKASQNVIQMLEQVRKKDENKFLLLKTFYLNLKETTTLAESQDIRQFAQDIGLKEISGKSRKDLIPKLMRFLVKQPTQRLRSNIRKASNVSEQVRQQGFSVLTDKLLR